MLSPALGGSTLKVRHFMRSSFLFYLILARVTISMPASPVASNKNEHAHKQVQRFFVFTAISQYSGIVVFGLRPSEADM